MERLRRRLPLALAALALASSVPAGCGEQDDPEADVRATLDALAQAVAQKDFQRLCDRIYAPELVKQIESVLPCEVALQRSTLASAQRPKLEVRSVTVKGNSATARIRTSAANEKPSDDTAKLVKQGDDWRVIALAS